MVYLLWDLAALVLAQVLVAMDDPRTCWMHFETGFIRGAKLTAWCCLLGVGMLAQVVPSQAQIDRIQKQVDQNESRSQANAIAIGVHDARSGHAGMLLRMAEMEEVMIHTTNAVALIQGEAIGIKYSVIFGAAGMTLVQAVIAIFAFRRRPNGA